MENSCGAKKPTELNQRYDSFWSNNQRRPLNAIKKIFKVDEQISLKNKKVGRNIKEKEILALSQYPTPSNKIIKEKFTKIERNKLQNFEKEKENKTLLEKKIENIEIFKSDPIEFDEPKANLHFENFKNFEANKHSLYSKVKAKVDCHLKKRKCSKLKHVYNVISQTNNHEIKGKKIKYRIF